MVKRVFPFLACLILILSSCNKKEKEEDTTETSDSITGLWYSTDHKTSKIRCLVDIYPYQGLYYGRILVTYDAQGNANDTILLQIDKAPGLVGDPPYCGLDFIYKVKEKTNPEGEIRYKGKIVDPEAGKEYKVQLWREGNDLIVRGELWIFGRNIRWLRATKEALPTNFSYKEIKNFIPVVPQTK